MSLLSKVNRKTSLSKFIDRDENLKRTIDTKDLIMMGIGAVIGTGIFILPGTVAATTAGPGIILSFVLATIVCSLCAMCYAEFSSALPIAGSAYSFGNVIFGELTGWVIGWGLILEYMLSVATVSSGWSAYLQSFLRSFGIFIPKAISANYNPSKGTYVDVIAILIVVFISWILTNNVKSSTKLNDIMVLVKISIIIIFVVAGIFFVKPGNWNPFLPFGVHGIFKGASLVFFAYLGFDVIASSAGEVKKPERTMPIGIIGTLLICTVLYILVSIVLTGIVPYTDLNVSDPVTYALQVIHLDKLSVLISLGALAGMFTMMINMIYSSSRLIYSIGRDGLLPQKLSKINKKNNVPKRSIIFVTIIIAFMGGLVSLDKLASLVNIGTLIAFTFMSIGIIPLRKRKDINNSNGFKVPFYPILPIVSALACIYLLTQLSLETWLTAIIWFIIGLVIYFGYGIKHSRTNNEK
ncbi:APC family permease [Apilactobacillus micheneri]|uniref:Amino acid permease n=1 Tax=Apilactobacillus micheneri TaxID=1899430 RepID=A0A9Q8IPB1_9LACO|nr:amino acid permease [Apilactobacillus micheneri]TPR41036.1 amino acid permease [Apilactobacillus micheneri]TPR42616.1 amino acid permease [Apilactobacillus micheneri]TPR45584.1 amino acid permease [Apilactobacillus micheneri]TPR46143.1 amino acid permease [Apilactobacillus micheneri]TPR46828.1 amino acid permease [Apilactobacillus micheneri]